MNKSSSSPRSARSTLVSQNLKIHHASSASFIKLSRFKTREPAARTLADNLVFFVHQSSTPPDHVSSAASRIRKRDKYACLKGVKLRKDKRRFQATKCVSPNVLSGATRSNRICLLPKIQWRKREVSTCTQVATYT